MKLPLWSILLVTIPVSFFTLILDRGYTLNWVLMYNASIILPIFLIYSFEKFKGKEYEF